jgi:hypothetical protein
MVGRGRLNAALFFYLSLIMFMRLVIREKAELPVGAGSAEQGFPGSSLVSPSFRQMDDEALNECNCPCRICAKGDHHEEDYEEPEELDPEVLAGLYNNPEAIYIVIEQEELSETKKKKKGDRCVRIARRKYHKWPSAYASGAVVKCRQGKIWKGLKESSELVEYEIYEATIEEAANLLEKYKPNFSLEKSQGLHGWFKRNKGKGWIDCKTGKPCGRKKAGRGARRKYPACRPTKAQCNKAGTRRKKTSATVSWKPKKDK